MLPQGSEWTFKAIEQYDEAIREVADAHGWEYYPYNLEIITSEAMMDAYCSVGMPVYYNHWTFGKQHIQLERTYERGQMSLAYEIVINSDPCIAYLMEENSLTMQALVIAHAAIGHNSYFCNSNLFRQWTNADSIIDYMLFARNYIAKCEEKFGMKEVEEILDSAHALANLGVDRYKRKPKLSLAKEKALQKEREEYLQSQVNDIWRTLPFSDKPVVETHKRFPEQPEENVLYFIEKNAPLLKPWQREIIRIIRKVHQYFYPQRMTKVLNEGWATFVHHHILNQLYDQKQVGDGFMLEFLKSHTGVVAQPPYNSKYYSGWNPYALGFALFTDIKRICDNPTEEDKKWFPDWAGDDWLKVSMDVVKNYKDESALLQFLSPKLMRDFHMFEVLDDDKNEKLRIDSIHNEEGYRRVRCALASTYDVGLHDPNIQVWDVDVQNTRTLTLRYTATNRQPLAPNYRDVLAHVTKLWGFDVKLDMCVEDEIKASYTMPRGLLEK